MPRETKVTEVTEIANQLSLKQSKGILSMAPTSSPESLNVEEKARESISEKRNVRRVHPSTEDVKAKEEIMRQ